MTVFGYSRDLVETTEDAVTTLQTVTDAVVHKVLQIQHRLALIDDTADLGDLDIDSELAETERN